MSNLAQRMRRFKKEWLLDCLIHLQHNIIQRYTTNDKKALIETNDPKTETFVPFLKTLYIPFISKVFDFHFHETHVNVEVSRSGIWALKEKKKKVNILISRETIGNIVLKFIGNKF